MPFIETKLCGGCDIVQLISNFPPITGAKDKLKYPNQTHHPRCLTCVKLQRNESARKNRKANRLKCLVYYSKRTPRCACCGETEVDFLTMDHENGGGRQHVLSLPAHNLIRWLIKNNFPLGFRVLCANCNFGRARNGGVCPHEEKRLAAQAAD